MEIYSQRPRMRLVDLIFAIYGVTGATANVLQRVLEDLFRRPPEPDEDPYAFLQLLDM